LGGVYRQVAKTEHNNEGTARGRALFVFWT